MSEILVLRLVTGEEIIGKVDIVRVQPGLNGEIYKIKNPAILLLGRDPESGVPVGLAGLADPLQLSEKDDTIKLKADHVLWSYKPMTKLETAYNEAYGSGLIVPENTGVLLKG